MFITIYKKLPNNAIYLIRFELVNNKFRKWRGQENSVMKASKWREFKNTSYQTGKACASMAMFKEMNSFIEKGYSVYKKRSKKIKIVKPIIKIRKISMKKIKKLFEEGNDLFVSFYNEKLAVRKTDCSVYDNFTHRQLRAAFQKNLVKKTELGYWDGFTFKPFTWNTQGSPKELELWMKFSKAKKLKTLIKIKDYYYG